MGNYRPERPPALQAGRRRSMRLGQNANTGRQNWMRRATLFFGSKPTQAEFVKNFTSSGFHAENSFPKRWLLLLIFESDVFTRVDTTRYRNRRRGVFFEGRAPRMQGKKRIAACLPPLKSENFSRSRKSSPASINRGRPWNGRVQAERRQPERQTRNFV